MFYVHPIAAIKLAEKITPARLSELTKRIKEGILTDAEEAELIDGHMQLILSLAQKWSARSPHLIDVFVADGLFAALKAIRKAKDKLRPEYSLTQYIVVHVKTAFKDAVINQQVMKGVQAGRKDRTVTVKGKTYLVKKTTLKRHSLPNDDADMGHEWTESTPVQRSVIPRIQVKLTAKMDHVELREIIRESTKTSQEEVVLEMKRQGYTINEIADKLSTNRKNVRKILNIIEDRLRSLLA